MEKHTPIRRMRRKIRIRSRRVITLAVNLSTTTATMVALVGLGTTGLASATSAVPTSCPAQATLSTYLTADNVGASYTVNGTTSTYRFNSFEDENPVGGVPGLTRYCVYQDDGVQPDSITPQAAGANGALWTGDTAPGAFSFKRPDGNQSNIPFDGNSTQVGTATWNGGAPAAQTILLHLNDPVECEALYGDTSRHGGKAPYGGNGPFGDGDDHGHGHDHGHKGGHGGGHKGGHGHEGGCWVKPALPCATGSQDPDIRYTALPVGILACPAVPSEAFEGTSSQEFGDEVGLSSTTGTLQSLRVLFQSYGCGDSGHWFSDDCVTTPGATFTHPITANIYAVNNTTSPPSPGALLATVTQNQVIRFRPSKDPVNCTGANAGKWLNPANGLCVNSIPQLLTFDFPAGTTLPSQVIWTVAFNTTHYGNPPIGEGAPCYSTNPGCGYDSLNVGVFTFPGAPYVGTDVDPSAAFLDSEAPSQYCDGGTGGVDFLRFDAPCWAGYTPLGEIRLT